jgi:GlpG protein
MRCIGRLAQEDHAHRFRDYLLTRGIDSRVDADNGAFAVWILDEDKLAAAREELAMFETQPEAPQYLSAIDEAQQRRKQQLDEELATRKRQIDLRRRWEAPLIRRVPVTIALIVLSGMATAVTRFGEDQAAFEKLRIASLQSFILNLGAANFEEARQGQVWRLITPIFVHMDVLHLLFNMYWLYLFGGLIEATRGQRKYLAMVLVLAVVSNVAQYLYSGPNFGGMSGVGYGLFGYLWFMTRFRPEEGYALPTSTIVMFVIWTVLCMTDRVGPVANAAHLGGLAMGAVLAAIGLVMRGRSL